MVTSDDEDAARNVAIVSVDVDPLDRLVEDEVGELVDRAQKANQRSPVAQHHLAKLDFYFR